MLLRSRNLLTANAFRASLPRSEPAGVATKSCQTAAAAARARSIHSTCLRRRLPSQSRLVSGIASSSNSSDGSLRKSPGALEVTSGRLAWCGSPKSPQWAKVALPFWAGGAEVAPLTLSCSDSAGDAAAGGGGRRRSRREVRSSRGGGARPAWRNLETRVGGVSGRRRSVRLVGAAAPLTSSAAASRAGNEAGPWQETDTQTSRRR